MTNTFDPTNAPATPLAGSRRTRSAWHIVAIVAGCMLLLPAVGMLFTGGAVAVAQAVATDDDGYFNATFDRVESDGVAIAATDVWLDGSEDDATPWVLDWIDLDLRLRVDGAATTDDVFVGIARAADIERYLDGVPHSEVVEIDNRTARYSEVRGERRVTAPVDEDFWVASANGSGEQTLTWEARGGRWAIVVMNADGTAGVAADVQVGARSGAVTPIAVTLLIVGGLLTIGAITLIVVGARGRRVHGDDANTGVAGPGPLPAPMPETAVRLDADHDADAAHDADAVTPAPDHRPMSLT